MSVAPPLDLAAVIKEYGYLNAHAPRQAKDVCEHVLAISAWRGGIVIEKQPDGTALLSVLVRDPFGEEASVRTHAGTVDECRRKAQSLLNFGYELHLADTATA